MAMMAVVTAQLPGANTQPPLPPAPQAKRSGLANTQHHGRRRQRQREGIWSLLSSLPSPYGLHAPRQYRNLHSWAGPQQEIDSPIDWRLVHPVCEPGAFLADPATRPKKSKSIKSVMQEYGLLSEGQGSGQLGRAQSGQQPLATLPAGTTGLSTSSGDRRGVSNSSDGEEGPGVSSSGTDGALGAGGQRPGRRQAARTAKKAAAAEEGPGPQRQAQLDRRALHKKWQVESFKMVLQRLIDAEPGRAFHIVDFGSGTGGLLLPLACLFPHCQFTGVDMNPAAIVILRQRAAEAGLLNVQARHARIEGYQEPFDIAMALHACGNATDMAMLQAEAQRAAYIVSPCCVGKLKFSLEGGTSTSASSAAWAWNPRMRHMTVQEKQLVGERLMAAAAGGPAPPPATEAGTGPALGSDVPAGTKYKSPEWQRRELLAAVAAGDDGDNLRLEGEGGKAAGVGLSLSHPRSREFAELLPDSKQQYKLLAQTADTVYPGQRGQLWGWVTPPSPTSQPGEDALQHTVTYAKALAAALARLDASDSRSAAGGCESAGESELGLAVAGDNPEKETGFRTAGSGLEAVGARWEESEGERGGIGGEIKAPEAAEPLASTSLQPQTRPDTDAEHIGLQGSSAVSSSASIRIGRGDGQEPAACKSGAIATAKAGENDLTPNVTPNGPLVTPSLASAEAGGGSDQPALDEEARRAAFCALAKLHVELDRNQAAREANYAVGTFRMLHSEAMSKGDLLVGVPAEDTAWASLLYLLQLPEAA